MSGREIAHLHLWGCSNSRDRGGAAVHVNLRNHRFRIHFPGFIDVAPLGPWQTDIAISTPNVDQFHDLLLTFKRLVELFLRQHHHPCVLINDQSLIHPVDSTRDPSRIRTRPGTRTHEIFPGPSGERGNQIARKPAQERKRDKEATTA